MSDGGVGIASPVAASVSVLRPGSAAADRITELGEWLSDATTTLVVRSIVAVVLVAVAYRYMTTGRARLAQWSAMFAVVLGVSLLSARGAVLAEWRWSEVGIDRVMLAGVVVLAVVHVARRAVTPSFVTHAGSLVVVGALFSQSGFVSDPLGALFGFAGLGFLVFGLVWGFVTGGAEVKSATTPHEATALLVGVLGRSLFSVVVIAWAVAARQTELSAQLPAFTELGRTTVGTGVLVGVSLWLFGAAAGWDTDPRLTPDAEESAPAATAPDELPDAPVLSPT